MVVSSSWGRRTLLLGLYLCGLTAHAMEAVVRGDKSTATGRTIRTPRLRSSFTRRRHLQDAAAAPRGALVRNIELQVGDAPTMLSTSEIDQFETIVEDWLLEFYEASMRNITLIDTTVTFNSQTIDGKTSIIRYNQEIMYIPLGVDIASPVSIVTTPFGSFSDNALLSSRFTDEIAAWSDRKQGLFLFAPKVLGRIPTNLPTAAPIVTPTDLPTDAPIVAPTTDAPTGTPVVAPITLAPVLTEAPTSAPTSSPTSVQATAVPSIEPTTTMAPTISMAPVVPTAAPTWSFTSNRLQELQLVYNNVDNIDDQQFKTLENVTQDWFNEYYNASASSNVTDDEEDQDAAADAAPEMNATADFIFIRRVYVNRTMTVLFDVQLSYTGDPDDALDVLQQPWNETNSVGAYRQLLVAEFPIAFVSVEATEPPELLTVVKQPSPSPPNGDGGLSTAAIIGILCIVIVVIVLIGVAAKLQYGIMARRKRNSGDKIKPSTTTPYQPHVNEEEEDSVLFPQAPTAYGSSSSNNNNNNQNPAVAGAASFAVDASTADGVSQPYEKSEDQSYDGKSVDTTEFDYSKVGANTVGPKRGYSSTGLSSASDSVASSRSNLYGENSSDMLSPLDSEDQFVIYAPAGKLGLVVDNRDDGPPVIHSIKEDSVLIDQIQVGDRLVGVDEVDVRTMSPVKVSKLISKRSTNPLRKLTLTRGGVKHDLTADDTTAGGRSSFMGGMSRMSESGVDTDSNEDESALGQGFSDDDSSFVGSMSRVSGDGQSMDSSAVPR